MALNPKQKLFVKAYLVSKNATAAAKKAGYSPKSAHSIGEENLRKPEIKAEIDKELKAQAEKHEISADRVIKEISEIAFQKLTKPEMKTKSGNKLKALEHLGRHFNLFTDSVQMSAAVEGFKVVLSMPSNGSEAPKKQVDD